MSLPKRSAEFAISGVATIDDVRGAGHALVGFSGAFEAEERELKRFLYGRLYDAPELKALREEAERIGPANLAVAYRADPSLLPEAWQRPGERLGQLRAISDFIAGMTDRYAISRHTDLVGPVNLAADRF